MIRVLFVATFLSLNAWAISQDLVDWNYEGDSKASSQSEARSEIIQNGIEAATVKFVGELIGEHKTLSLQDRIKKKILPQSSRYILSVKETPLQGASGSTRIALAFKVGVSNLKQVLLAEGLLYELQGPPKVLPALAVEDVTQNVKYFWWSQGDPNQDLSFLKEISRRISGQFEETFKKQGFHYIDPLAPSNPKNQSATRETDVRLAEDLKAAILVRGDVKILNSQKRPGAYSLEFRWIAIQSLNGRVLGEIVRTFESEVGSGRGVVFQKLDEVKESVVADLVSQVVEDWKKGTFGSSQIELVIRGVRDYQQLTSLKNSLLREVREIRGLRERRFSPGELQFEVDSSVSTSQLADILTKVGPADSLKWTVNSSTPGRVELSLR